jgi:hypothetical protein
MAIVSVNGKSLLRNEKIHENALASVCPISRHEITRQGLEGSWFGIIDEGDMRSHLHGNKVGSDPEQCGPALQP